MLWKLPPPPVCDTTGTREQSRTHRKIISLELWCTDTWCQPRIKKPLGRKCKGLYLRTASSFLNVPAHVHTRNCAPSRKTRISMIFLTSMRELQISQTSHSVLAQPKAGRSLGMVSSFQSWAPTCDRSDFPLQRYTRPMAEQDQIFSVQGDNHSASDGFKWRFSRWANRQMVVHSGSPSCKKLVSHDHAWKEGIRAWIQKLHAPERGFSTLDAPMLPVEMISDDSDQTWVIMIMIRDDNGQWW